MRISIIGSGNIGGAIARGLAKGTMFKASDITCTAQSDETLEKMRKIDPDFILTHDNVEAARNADIIIIAVKPWRVEMIIDEIKSVLDFEKQIIVSVAAGVTFRPVEYLFDQEYRLRLSGYSHDLPDHAQHGYRGDEQHDFRFRPQRLQGANGSNHPYLQRAWQRHVGRRTVDGRRNSIGFQRHRFRLALYPCGDRRRRGIGFLSETSARDRGAYRERRR